MGVPSMPATILSTLSSISATEMPVLLRLPVRMAACNNTQTMSITMQTPKTGLVGLQHVFSNTEDDTCASQQHIWGAEICYKPKLQRT